MPNQTLIIGTRGSKLALWQSHHVQQQLQQRWLPLRCEIQTFVTEGDKTLGKPLPQIGGKGLFTAELEAALRNGRIDLAVHSLKDLPVADAPGLILGAIGSRADVHDVLVTANGSTLATLPTGATIGTSSLRRQAQLLAHRPDLTVRSIRGNVDTRIGKVLAGEYDAVVLAQAGVERLGLMARVSEQLPLSVMLPAPGQGALAVQCRADDAQTLALLAAIEETAVRVCVTAERAFLAGLGSGCSLPVAAYATLENDDIQLTGLVARVDGSQVIRVTGNGRSPHAVGTALAAQATAQGAEALLP